MAKLDFFFREPSKILKQSSSPTKVESEQEQEPNSSPRSTRMSPRSPTKSIDDVVPSGKGARKLFLQYKSEKQKALVTKADFISFVLSRSFQVPPVPQRVLVQEQTVEA